jgi:hypothetical protein
MLHRRRDDYTPLGIYWLFLADAHPRKTGPFLGNSLVSISDYQRRSPFAQC